MKILALDLSTRQGSIAFCDGDNTLCHRTWQNDRRSSAPFFEALESAINRHGDAELVVVGLGPGSYTGTRIALAAAVGLTAAGQTHLAGLASVVAMSDEREFLVIGDAKRASFFFAHVRPGQVDVALDLLSAEELRARLAQSDLPVFTSDDLPSFPQVGRCFPSAVRLAWLARRFPQKLSRAPLAPIYLREPHITTPRP